MIPTGKSELDRGRKGEDAGKQVLIQNLKESPLFFRHKGGRSRQKKRWRPNDEKSAVFLKGKKTPPPITKGKRGQSGDYA